MIRASVSRSRPETWIRSGPRPPSTWTGTLVTYSLRMTWTIEPAAPRISSGRIARRGTVAIAVVGTPVGRARRPGSSSPLGFGTTTEAAANGVASSRRIANDSGSGSSACTLHGTSCSSTGDRQRRADRHAPAVHRQDHAKARRIGQFQDRSPLEHELAGTDVDIQDPARERRGSCSDRARPGPARRAPGPPPVAPRRRPCHLANAFEGCLLFLDLRLRDR